MILVFRMIDTAVIIVNWNGKKYLKDCFDSLETQMNRNFKVIFDNSTSETGDSQKADRFFWRDIAEYFKK